MLRTLSRHMRQNAVAWLALFVAVSTGGAYAANTIGSSDIIDGQVKSVDIGDGEVKSADVKDQSLTTFDVSTFLGADVVDGTLTGADVGDMSLTGDDIANFSLTELQVASNTFSGAVIQNNSLQSADIKDGTLTGADVADNSLKGADIDESSLGQVPSATDSNNLGGVGSGDYVRGPGTEQRQADLDFTNQDHFRDHFLPGALFDYECDDDGRGMIWLFHNLSGGVMRVWFTDHKTNTLTFRSLDASGDFSGTVSQYGAMTFEYTIGGAVNEFSAWLAGDGKCQVFTHLATSGR